MEDADTTKLKDRIAGRIRGTPLFSPARAVYWAIFGGKIAANLKSLMCQFYSQFIRSGNTVFDIGANVGEYAEVFASLGAQVIAVEPNTACFPSLRRLAQKRRGSIRLYECAVGAASGFARLHVCSRSLYSTMSTRWIGRTRNLSSHQDVRWTGSIEVRLVTLDWLAAHHGQPAFVKIDVEGYELSVLHGMSFDPPYLSFEWNAPMRDVALDCIRLLGSRGYVFNCVRGRTLAFLHPRWLTPDDAERWLLGYDESAEEYGDVFARRVQSNVGQD